MHDGLREGLGAKVGGVLSLLESSVWPSPHQLNCLFRPLASTPTLLPSGAMTPHQLASCAWALPRLGIPLGLPVRTERAFREACIMHLPHFTDQGLANMLWGVARCEADFVQLLMRNSHYRHPPSSSSSLNVTHFHTPSGRFMRTRTGSMWTITAGAEVGRRLGRLNAIDLPQV